jgi:cytochrome c553
MSDVTPPAGNTLWVNQTMATCASLSRTARLAALLGALLAPPLLAADRPATLPDSIEQRLLACTSCHARKDSSERLFPRIAGKPAGYLYNQLLNFREGRRTYPLMTYMVDHLPDPYLQEIADYFSSQHLPAPALQPTDVSAATLARGRLLATEGDTAIKVPACMACHGQQLTGVAPAIPGLLGLPRDYVNAQFGAWKNKVRRAHAPDCMAAIAERLSLDDVAAVSAWLVSRPLPPDPRPAPAIARPLPLQCGSAPD